MITKVARTIEAHNLVSPGEKVLAGLSGGPDSVALLFVLHKLTRKLGFSLSAVYLNHRLRPRAAKKEEKFCRKLCDSLGVELIIRTEDIPAHAKKLKKGIEETAREIRYAVFEELAKEYGFDKIALAHHVDDRVETVLFRILRGTGRTGLQGIPIRRGKIIRPLYEITKHEIYDFLEKHHLPYCLDRSNLKTDFARNYIRNRLLPLIRKHLNPNVDAALLNLSETAAEEEAFLEAYVAKRQKKIVKTTVGGKLELDLKAFISYDIWLRRRLLRRCLTELSGSASAPDKEVVDRLDKFCLSGGTALSLPQSIQAVRAKEKIVLFKKRRIAFSHELIPGRLCRLSELRLNLKAATARPPRGSVKTPRQARQVWVDWETLTPPLVVRSIKPGDRFTPLGMKGTKKVGDYLTDRKVPKVYRDEIPVVVDGKGIVWLVGYEIDERVKINAHTSRVMKIEVCERRKKQESSL